MFVEIGKVLLSYAFTFCTSTQKNELRLKNSTYQQLGWDFY